MSTKNAKVTPAPDDIQNSAQSNLPSSPTPKPSPPVIKPLDPKDEIRKNLTLDFKWRKDGFGSILMADITISNNSKFPVKDILIDIQTFAPSGTRLGRTKHTLYQTVAPFSKSTISNFNAGFIDQQSSNAGAKILDFQY